MRRRTQSQVLQCPDPDCGEFFRHKGEMVEHMNHNPSHLKIRQDQIVVVFAHGGRMGMGRYAIGTNACTMHTTEARKKLLPKYLQPHSSHRAALYAIVHALRNAPISSTTKALTVNTDVKYAVETVSMISGVWIGNGFKDSNGRDPENIDLIREISGLVAVTERLGCRVEVKRIAKEANAMAIQLAKQADTD